MTDVLIVIPVYNERIALEGSVRRIHGFLERSFPFSWQILIVDNASIDGTHQIARRLTYELDRVDAMRLPEKGRGRALRAAWSEADARVVCYMDVDLSTDLTALLPLVAPLVSGHSDVAHRHPARAWRTCHARFPARVHLPDVQPPAASRPQIPLQRRAVRLQGGPPRRRGGVAPSDQGRGVVLRHRAARPRRASRAADPRGSRRLGGGHRHPRPGDPDGPRRPAWRRPAARSPTRLRRLLRCSHPSIRCWPHELGLALVPCPERGSRVHASGRGFARCAWPSPSSSG